MPISDESLRYCYKFEENEAIIIYYPKSNYENLFKKLEYEEDNKLFVMRCSCHQDRIFFKEDVKIDDIPQNLNLIIEEFLDFCKNN